MCYKKKYCVASQVRVAPFESNTLQWVCNVTKRTWDKLVPLDINSHEQPEGSGVDIGIQYEVENVVE